MTNMTPSVPEHGPAPSSLRGIALDLDGVIVDSMRFHAQSWREAFRHLGFDLPGEWIFEWEGIPFAQVIDLALARLGAEITPAEKQALHHLKYQHFQATFQVIPMAGISALAQMLQAFGYRAVVATGSERAVALRVLKTLGLAEIFTAVVGDDDVTRGKPSPEPYLKAVERLGADPACCLVLENAPAGVQAAKAAGLFCLAVATYLEPHYLAAADAVLPDLNAVASLLRQEYADSGGQGRWQL